MTNCRPNYLKYDGQYNAQDAHLYLTKSGKLYTKADPEIGNAVSADIFHGLTLTWKIPNDLTESGIEEILALARPIADKILENSKIGYNQQNNLTRKMTKEAKGFYEEMEMMCQRFEDSNYDYYCGEEACEYCHQE